jgi:beta-glucosidase
MLLERGYLMINRKEAREKAKEVVNKMTLEELVSQLKYDYGDDVASQGAATSFPPAIGLAATFDDALIEEIGSVNGIEGRAKYNEFSKKEGDIYKGLIFYSPNVNIFRDPRCKRGHETYGEDPFLSGRLGVAFVQGLQGERKYLKVVACIKDFTVYTGAENKEHRFEGLVSKKDLWETYLPAFEACVYQGKAEAVVGAYNQINREPCCGSENFKLNTLRKRWSFQDHFISNSLTKRDFYEEYIVRANQDGLVTEKEITQAAERLFTIRFLLGLMDGSEYDRISFEKVECKEHLEVAERATRESVVLLKNNGILPINKDKIRTIGIIGSNANSRVAMVGNDDTTASSYITVLEGIQNQVGSEVSVLYAEGAHSYKENTKDLSWNQDRLSEAVMVTKHSDVVVICLGLDETLDGKPGDKADLSLPKAQQELLEAVANVGKPSILCLMSGSTIDLNYAKDKVDGILQLWYPGARGGKAVADILFGKCSPSGKLPITFYKSLSSLPDFGDYSMENRTYRYIHDEALYPFGYGLTYGKIEVVGGKEIYKVRTETEMFIEATVSNRGTYDSEDVIQIYSKDLDSPFAVRNHSLCGYKRVFLRQGETKKIVINIHIKQFAIVDDQGNRYIDGKEFILYIGVCQPDNQSVRLSETKPIALRIKL